MGRMKAAVRRIKRNTADNGQENQVMRLESQEDWEVEMQSPKINNMRIRSPLVDRFFKKTCILFEPDEEKKKKQKEPGGPVVCKCGRPQELHKSIDAVDGNIAKLRQEPWKSETHLVKRPTNACGTIEFYGVGRKSQAKYIRVADDTSGKDAFDLLRSEWEVTPPKLLISVTGGAKNFRLEPRLKRLFQQGLLKVAQTSGAWVITGGTNTGVMKHTGKALQGASHHSYGFQGHSGHGRNRVFCIGVATWGIVDHRMKLVNTNDLVQYHMRSSMESYGACLDNNHTHFFLVDNGTVDSYGHEIKFRGRLEKEIMTFGQGVPAVQLVLEGGPNTIKTIYEAIDNQPPMPVVIIKDSGRAADLIAYAYDSIHGEGEVLDVADVAEHAQLLAKVKEVNPTLNEEKCQEIYQDILNVVKKKKYVTIFSMEEGSADLDQAILTALLKSQKTKKIDQLKLAVTWNRADIARTEIFFDDGKLTKDAMEKEMMTALCHDKVEFVELFREQGVDLNKFLTQERLRNVYNTRATMGDSMMKYLFAKEKCRNQTINLHDVDKVLVELLGDSMEDRYTDIIKATERDKPWNIQATHELFIWAVICNMKDMAVCFWKMEEEALSKALVGCKMFHSMISIAERKNVPEDLINAMSKNLKEFQCLAIQLLDECARLDEHLAGKLLTYQLKNWGDNTCLSWAVAAEFEEFVAHGSCQALLSEMWDGAMSIKTHQSLKTFCAIIIPPLLFTFKFATKEERDAMPTMEEPQQAADEDLKQSVEDLRGQENHNSVDDDGKSSPFVAVRQKSDIERQNDTYSRRPKLVSLRSSSDRGPELLWYQKIHEFYKAPITKFWSNVLAYIVFLGLFAYVTLVQLPPKPSVAECVLIAFVITLTTEEIRQLLESDADQLYKKFWEWGSSKWNICDAIAIILFFVGLLLRLFEATKDAGHVVYSIDIMLWVVRLLDIFSVNKYLGPYVVMIGRMTADMMYFLFVMVVFLLAYGIARQAILDPHPGASWALLGKVLFAPYFQVYGELFTDRERPSVTQTIFGTTINNDYAETLVTLIMGFYLLVANILLLNLLIAIFNHTYDEVQANSKQIWKFQRYHLIMEYSTRPIFIPPFIIINHIILVAQWLWKLIRRKKGKKQTKKLKFDPLKPMLRKLMTFEEDCLASYMTAKKSLQLAGQEEKIRLMAQRVDTIGTKVAEVSKAGFNREKTMKQTLKRLEGKIEFLARLIPRDDGLISPHEPAEGSRRPSNYPSVQLPLIGRISRQASVFNERLSPKVTRKSPLAGSFKGEGETVPVEARNATVEAAAKLLKQRSLQLTAEHQPSTRLLSDEGEQKKKNYGRMQSMRSIDQQDSHSNSSLESDETRERRRTKSCPNRKSLKNDDEQQSSTTCDEDVSPEDVQLSETSESPAVFYFKCFVHQKSRQSPYPSSNVHRYPVPDFAVNWEISFPEYTPRTFTDRSVTVAGGTDPLYLGQSSLKFNDIDGEINRRSNVGLYGIVDGMPRNPMGRTGINGRGRLPYWGPNHMIYTIVSRWQRDKEGDMCQRTDKNILEFFALKGSGGYLIPSGPMKANQAICPTLQASLTHMLQTSDSATSQTEIDHFFTSGREIFKGYVDDARNTDNAWVERTVVNFHDEDGHLTKHLQDGIVGSSSYYSWQEIKKGRALDATHLEFLAIVAELKVAAF